MSRTGSGATNLTRVRALWSPLYAWNYASQIGGDPLESMETIYGLSRHGKSLLMYLRYRSHLDAGGVVYHVPAERGEDPDFLRAVLGHHFDGPNFIVPDPETVFTFSWLSNTAAEFGGQIARQTKLAREQGHDWVGGLFGCDSVVAIMPDEIADDLVRDSRWDEYEKSGGRKHEFGDASSAETMTDRFAKNNHWMRLANQVGGWFWAINSRFRAENVTSVWLTQCAQKGSKVVGTGIRRKTIPIYEPKLGRGLYEPHQLMRRVEVDDRLVDDNGDVPAVRHRVRIQKNKHGSIPEGRERVFEFYFRKDQVELDHARNLLFGCIYAEQLTGESVIVQAGSHFKFDGASIGNGRAAALRALRSDPDLFSAIAGALQEHELRTRAARRGTIGLVSPDDAGD